MRDDWVMLEKLLTYSELSAQTGIPIRSLRTLVHNGVLPSLRFGHRTIKFAPSKVEKAIAKREVREVAK
jgi:excisionase family DNA binding protein